MTIVYPFNWLINNDTSVTDVYPHLVWSEVVEEVSSSSSSSGLDLIVADVEPVVLTISSVTLSSFLQVNTEVVELPVLVVAPNLQIQANLSVVETIISVVDATSLIQCNLTPITITITVVSPAGVTTIDVEPVELNLSVVAPLLEKLYNQTPVDLTCSIVAPLLQLQVNEAPVSLTLETVALTTYLQANVSPVNIVITVITVMVEGGTPVIPPEVVTATPSIVAKTNIFSAFNERLKFIHPIVSEFVFEDSKFPYISLGQVFNVLSWKNTCLQRFEEGQYSLKIYTESFTELEQKIKEIEDTLIYDTLLLASPKDVISLQQVSKSIEEVKRELYYADLVYEVIIQKNINREYINSPTTGETLNKCIFERSKLLKIHHNAFVSPGYVLENTKLPYITVPKISETKEWYHSKGHVDQVNYPITIKTEDLYELLDIMDEVEAVFDYARFEIEGKEHLINEWVSTEVVELEPQVFCGKVNYEILVESTIDSYGNNE